MWWRLGERPSRWSDCCPENPCPEPRPAGRRDKQSGLKTVLFRKVYRLGQKRSKGATTRFAVAPLRFRTWLALGSVLTVALSSSQANKRSTQSDQSNPRSFCHRSPRWLQARDGQATFSEDSARQSTAPNVVSRGLTARLGKIFDVANSMLGSPRHPR